MIVANVRDGALRREAIHNIGARGYRNANTVYEGERQGCNGRHEFEYLFLERRPLSLTAWLVTWA